MGLIKYWILFCVAFILGMYTSKGAYIQAMGTDIKPGSLNLAREMCESTLPRNQYCVGEVVFKIVTKEEK